ncbi:MAG: hypothetical protein U5L95_00005, partial [Candidatus Saccharibacteria bacterium]|nr:hypothetical protein [Candidatus Saccharibacteria bacterium]
DVPVKGTRTDVKVGSGMASQAVFATHDFEGFVGDNINDELLLVSSSGAVCGTRQAKVKLGVD